MRAAHARRKPAHGAPAWPSGGGMDGGGTDGGAGDRIAGGATPPATGSSHCRLAFATPRCAIVALAAARRGWVRWEPTAFLAARRRW